MVTAPPFTRKPTDIQLNGATMKTTLFCTLVSLAYAVYVLTRAIYVTGGV